MIDLKKWVSPSSSKWMQSLLQDRFGNIFNLHFDESGFCRISLSDSLSFIDIRCDQYTFARSDSELPCTSWDPAQQGWQPAIYGSLPAPGASDLPSPLITFSNGNGCIGYDILGLTYWMLSRQEEVNRTDLDQYGRFPASASHAYKNNYLSRPIVDEWLHILAQVFKRVWPFLEFRQQRFNIKISHDVDRPSRYGFCAPSTLGRNMIGDILRRGNFKQAMIAPWIRLNSKHALHPSDPWNTFDWIMDVSEKHGLKSAFYFICGRTAPSKDADYELEHPAIRKLMREIHARGHEIGLHPSFNSYHSPEIICDEVARLRRVASQEGIDQVEWGGRMHYLRWENPTTLIALETAKMNYDSTLTYADVPGFRCGTCHEYQAFDPISDRAFNLRIRPLIAMECSVISTNYMGLGDGEGALRKFLELRQHCEAVQGSFTLLWHNSFLDNIKLMKLYENTISLI